MWNNIHVLYRVEFPIITGPFNRRSSLTKAKLLARYATRDYLYIRRRTKKKLQLIALNSWQFQSIIALPLYFSETRAGPSGGFTIFMVFKSLTRQRVH